MISYIFLQCILVINLCPQSESIYGKSLRSVEAVVHFSGAGTDRLRIDHCDCCYRAHTITTIDWMYYLRKDELTAVTQHLQNVNLSFHKTSEGNKVSSIMLPYVGKCCIGDHGQRWTDHPKVWDWASIYRANMRCSTYKIWLWKNSFCKPFGSVRSLCKSTNVVRGTKNKQILKLYFSKLYSDRYVYKYGFRMNPKIPLFHANVRHKHLQKIASDSRVKLCQILV